MTREEIAATLIEVMKNSTEEPVDWNGLTETSKIDALGFDSLSVLDLIFYIKEQFEFEVEVDELSGVSTFGDMLDFLEHRLQGTA